MARLAAAEPAACVAAQDRLRRQRTVSRRIDPDTGMAITRITLDPLTDEAMWQAVNTVIRSKIARHHRRRVMAA